MTPAYKDLLTLKGYKAYIAGIGLMAWGGAGLYFGVHGPDTAIEQVSIGLGLLGVRQALKDIQVPANVQTDVTVSTKTSSRKLKGK